MKRYIIILLISLFQFAQLKYVNAQNCATMNMKFEADITSNCTAMVMTMVHDKRANMPYLYVANKEAGLKIYNITTVAAPNLSATIPISSIGNLEVMNISQSGNYLYLALGNTFTNSQQAGMAIIDITTPTTPLVKDFFIVPSSGSGAGIVKVEGNYAYLGAMKSGLVILDITDKSNIVFVSKILPDINWPVNNPNANLYNARGMEVKNSIVYLCFDAGGIRIINCTNKSTPKETGRFANTALYQPLNLPRAYNNIVIDDTLAYVAVDYCGMEVLRIKDTSNIKLHSWWNPYNCPNNNWFSSPVHANEIYFNKSCKYAFLSTGKSDLMVVNLTNPAQPDSCNFYGGVNNNIGTWGVSSYGNQIYLSYVCSAVPFQSNFTGVKILTYTPCANGMNTTKKNEFSISPNPANCYLRIENDYWQWNEEYEIVDLMGKRLFLGKLSNSKTEIDISHLSSGIYFLNIGNTIRRFSKI